MYTTAPAEMDLRENQPSLLPLSSLLEASFECSARRFGGRVIGGLLVQGLQGMTESSVPLSEPSGFTLRTTVPMKSMPRNQ